MRLCFAWSCSRLAQNPLPAPKAGVITLEYTMNIMALVLLIVFSIIGNIAGRQIQAMFSGEVSRISSNGLRNAAHAAVYALSSTVVVYILAMLAGIGFSVLLWFIILFVMELLMTNRS